MTAPVDVEKWRRMVRAVGLAKPVAPAPRPPKKKEPAMRDGSGESPDFVPGLLSELERLVKPAPPPAPELPPKTGVGTCQERDADTGKKCSLQANHGGEWHNSSGLKFRACLPPGAPMPVRSLDLRATAQGDRAGSVHEVAP